MSLVGLVAQPPLCFASSAELRPAGKWPHSVRYHLKFFPTTVASVIYGPVAKW